MTATPLDTTPNTPLDAIKAAFLRTHDRLDTVTDNLAGTHDFDEDSEALGLLDSADHALATLVCEQLGYDRPDRNWVPNSNQHSDLYRYDNGEPIVVRVPIGTGFLMEVWPRFDTDEDVEAVLGYTINQAFSSAAREERDAAEAAAVVDYARKAHYRAEADPTLPRGAA